MRITVLGSGASHGIPVVTCDCEVCRSTDPLDHRLRTSIMVQTDNTTLVVDAGPDFRYQMLRAKVERVNAVLITHQHHDHIGGFDDLRPYIFRLKHPMPVYAAKEAQEEIRREYSYSFAENPYPGAPTYNLIEFDEEPFTIGDIEVVPMRLKHYTMTCHAFRFGKFAYVTDVHEVTEDAMRKLHGVEYLIVEALMWDKHYSHLNVEQALKVASDLGVKKAWLTHIGHHIGLAEKVNPTLPDNVKLAYDGLVIEC